MIRRLQKLHPIGADAVSERFRFITKQMDEGASTEMVIASFADKFQVSRRIGLKYLNRWFEHARNNSEVSTKPAAIFIKIWRIYESMLEKACSTKPQDTDQIRAISKDMLALAGYGPNAAKFRTTRPAKAGSPREKSAKDINHALQQQGKSAMAKLAAEMSGEETPTE